MNLIVYWTRFAENKIDDIYEYCEIKAGVSVAQKLVNGIIDRTIGLEKIPISVQKKNFQKNENKNLDIWFLKVTK